MSDVQQRIRDLKTRAKNRRDLRRYAVAASLVKDAIDLASKELESTRASEARASLASELADCWGILGGIERRWALDTSSDAAQRATHLQLSSDAYDAGYRYERDPDLVNNTSTYNRLNRVLVRLLLHPELLAQSAAVPDAKSGETLNVRAELEAVADQITSQGADDVWAAADLALLNLLLGRQSSTTAYAPFERKNPPDFAYQSAIDGIAPLAALDLPTAPELKRAQERLISSLERLQTP